MSLQNKQGKGRGWESRVSATAVTDAFSSSVSVLSSVEVQDHRFLYLNFLQSLVGTEVEALLMNGETIRGIFFTATPFEGCQMEAVLKGVRVYEGGMSKEDPNVPAGSTVRLPFDQVASIDVPKLDFEIKNHISTGGELQTDDSVKRGQSYQAQQHFKKGGDALAALDGRALQSVSSGWLTSGSGSGKGGLMDGGPGGSGGKWDQFEANRRLFKVTSNFDENLYTKALNTSTLSSSQKRDAEKWAHEIEHTTTGNVHLQEERGHRPENADGDQDGDEEARYSGVQRSKDARGGSTASGQWARAPAQANSNNTRGRKGSVPAPDTWNDRDSGAGGKKGAALDAWEKHDSVAGKSVSSSGKKQQNSSGSPKKASSPRTAPSSSPSQGMSPSSSWVQLDLASILPPASPTNTPTTGKTSTGTPSASKTAKTSGGPPGLSAPTPAAGPPGLNISSAAVDTVKSTPMATTALVNKDDTPAVAERKIKDKDTKEDKESTTDTADAPKKTTLSVTAKAWAPSVTPAAAGPAAAPNNAQKQHSIPFFLPPHQPRFPPGPGGQSFPPQQGQYGNQQYEQAPFFDGPQQPAMLYANDYPSAVPMSAEHVHMQMQQQAQHSSYYTSPALGGQTGNGQFPGQPQPGQPGFVSGNNPIFPVGGEEGAAASVADAAAGTPAVDAAATPQSAEDNSAQSTKESEGSISAPKEIKDEKVKEASQKEVAVEVAAETVKELAAESKASECPPAATPAAAPRSRGNSVASASGSASGSPAVSAATPPAHAHGYPPNGPYPMPYNGGPGAPVGSPGYPPMFPPQGNVPYYDNNGHLMYPPPLEGGNIHYMPPGQNGMYPNMPNGMYPPMGPPMQGGHMPPPYQMGPEFGGQFPPHYNQPGGQYPMNQMPHHHNQGHGNFNNYNIPKGDKMRYNNYNNRKGNQNNQGNHNHSPGIAANNNNNNNNNNQASPGTSSIPIAAGLDESGAGSGQSAGTAPSTPATSTGDAPPTINTDIPSTAATNSSNTTPNNKFNNQNRGGGYGHNNYNMSGGRNNNRYNNRKNYSSSSAPPSTEGGAQSTPAIPN